MRRSGKVFFLCVSHIENNSEAMPVSVDAEFLSGKHSGVGTRFRKTRLMGKRVACAEMKVTEHVVNDRRRMAYDPELVLGHAIPDNRVRAGFRRPGHESTAAPLTDLR